MKPRSMFFPLCLLWVPIFCSSGQVTTDADYSQPLKSGVMIEKVATHSEAEKSGIQAGDVLLIWTRADAKGKIESPFDLAQIEIEQAPRGNVTLDGLRGSEAHSWTIGPNVWGIEARPNFQGKLLDIYQEGQKLSDAGNFSEAQRQWQLVALETQRSQLDWIAPWLSFHSAEMLSNAKQYKGVDDAYRQAVQAIGNDSPTLAYVLLRWATSFRRRGDLDSAEKYYQQAAAVAENSGTEQLLAALSLNNLGNVARDRGDLAKEEENYGKALDIRQKIAPGGLAVAASFNNLGLVAKDRGDLIKAEEFHNQSLAIKQKLAPESLDVATSFNNLANVAENRGDLAKAEDYYLKALDIRQRLAPGSIDLAVSFNNLGVIARDRGDLAKAEEYFRQDLSIMRLQFGESLGVATTLSNLGVVARDQGDLAKADEYQREALDIQKKIAPGSLDVATSLNNLGSVAEDRGDLVIAEKYQRQAFDIRQKLAPESLEVAATLHNLGDVAEKRGDLAKAEKCYSHALAIMERLSPDGLETAHNLQDLGDLARMSRDLIRAEQFFRRALAIREKLAPDSASYAESLAALASILRDRRQLDAERLFKQALDAVETQTAHLGGSQDIRSEFRAKHFAYYKDYINLLILQKRPEEAFEVLERSRARALLETLAAAHADIRKGVEPHLVERERSLQADVAAKSNRRIRLLGDKHTQEQVTAVEKEISDLLAQYQQVEEQIRTSSPIYAALTKPRLLSAMQVQRQLLDNNTLLLEYSLGEDHSYVFALTSNSLNSYELPKRSEVEGRARRFYDILVARSHIQPGETDVQAMLRGGKMEAEYPQAAAALSRMILGPVASLLPGKRLLIVSDGILQYIPFAALPLPLKTPGPSEVEAEPLIASHEIVNLPSASVLQILREESARRSRPAKTVAVLADPVFSAQDERVERIRGRDATVMKAQRAGMRGQGGALGSADPAAEPPSQGLLLRSAAEIGGVNGPMQFSRLLFSRQEADAILKEAPAGETMRVVDFQANRSAAMNPDLAQYRIIHFATHGMLDSEHPEFSGLVLSLVDERGKPQDGYLQLTDIYNLNLPAEMVVLSACETGLGKEINGEGLVGLTRGFMYAGASRVLASLWKVDDAATAELMRRLYRGIFRDGLEPSAALQQAQMQMWKQKRWQSPYYWAGFVLQGLW